MPITTLTFAAGCAALIAVPGTSGFFSKELILDAAHKAGSPLFWVGAFVAVLTPFYMTRLFVVAFLGKHRSENAGHAHEVGPLMWVPLALLALLAVFSGYSFLNRFAPALPEHHSDMIHFNFVSLVSLTALLIGVVAGWRLYAGRDKDPIFIPLLRERFKFDFVYDTILIRYFQNLLASIIHFFDEFLINGLLVGGLSRSAVSFGNILRRVQSGNLQGYAFAFGLGVIFVIYFTVFI
jgi:NADH-quinone oxidoreductase subunit L